MLPVIFSNLPSAAAQPQQTMMVGSIMIIGCCMEHAVQWNDDNNADNNTLMTVMKAINNK